MTNLQKCIRLVKRMTFACAEGKSTKKLWVEFHEIEAKLTRAEVLKLDRYVDMHVR
jgi:hypothetical protein